MAPYFRIASPQKPPAALGIRATSSASEATSPARAPQGKGRAARHVANERIEGPHRVCYLAP